MFLRLLGLVYFFAWLCTLRQSLPLIGRDGLLPAQDFLGRVREAYGSGLASFWRVPTLFWLGCSDAALYGVAWLGLGLSVALFLGLTDVPVMAAVWILYMSIVHVGQLFYGYGWEILLLETSFLALFLCPMLKPGLFDARTPPPEPVFWLLRWLAFRLMFGAGLIKLRGDPCWRDLTCMSYHYETQPIPNPLSYYLHQLPPWFHSLEVLFNHFVELLVPWFAFGPRRVRHAAGVCLVAFQVLLILSGNLSFLNWLTLAICLSCFDDSSLERVLPRRIVQKAATLPRDATLSVGHRVAGWTLAALVAVLSLNPVVNMLSPGQAMNASFEPFDLVNTYGAFGSVGRQRPEIVIEGTDDEPGPGARWHAYELPCKPGDLLRRPCVTSPYHRRLDWQLWFAAMSNANDEPWFVHLVAKLLHGDRAVLSLFADVPFQERPPRYVRALLYRYQFTPSATKSEGWWRRTLIGEYLPPVSLDDARLRDYLASYGWTR